MAEPRRWFDPSQPQTLQGAVMLCYVDRRLQPARGSCSGPIPLGDLARPRASAGYGVANEKRWGYWLGIVLAGLTALLSLLLVRLDIGLRGIVLNLAFMVVLVALFLHPQSREYQRIWFK